MHQRLLHLTVAQLQMPQAARCLQSSCLPLPGQLRRLELSLELPQRYDSRWIPRTPGLKLHNRPDLVLRHSPSIPLSRPLLQPPERLDILRRSTHQNILRQLQDRERGRGRHLAGHGVRPPLGGAIDRRDVLCRGARPTHLGVGPVGSRLLGGRSPCSTPRGLLRGWDGVHAVGGNGQGRRGQGIGRRPINSRDRRPVMARNNPPRLASVQSVLCLGRISKTHQRCKRIQHDSRGVHLAVGREGVHQLLPGNPRGQGGEMEGTHTALLGAGGPLWRLTSGSRSR
mmetsp:Transcript_21630/g.55373  ORF Transcript_21630/g.55373 Transcript_21630/m.55373 type:complete len:284 (+) Transcript_21630:485-1336(+)